MPKISMDNEPPAPEVNAWVCRINEKVSKRVIVIPMNKGLRMEKCWGRQKEASSAASG